MYGNSTFAEWMFDKGNYRMSAYPRMEDKGTYIIDEIDKNELTLILHKETKNGATYLSSSVFSFKDLSFPKLRRNIFI